MRGKLPVTRDDVVAAAVAWAEDVRAMVAWDVPPTRKLEETSRGKLLAIVRAFQEAEAEAKEAMTERERLVELLKSIGVPEVDPEHRWTYNTTTLAQLKADQIAPTAVRVAGLKFMFDNDGRLIGFVKEEAFAPESEFWVEPRKKTP